MKNPTTLDKIKVSLCIPQYNRIDFLVANLKRIVEQTYFNIEIIISDDCSTDDTETRIKNLIPDFRFPILYKRNETNRGYDYNLRQSMELATGDYCFILGNDDTLWGNHAIEYLVGFLESNNLPDVGFCNFIEDHNHNQVIERASTTAVIGSGYDCALKYYRSFSFVAGIIYKRSAFEMVNTSRFDGSVFVQMYFAAKIISSGGRFFTIKEPLVLKDIRMGENMANSYRDTLPRKWKDYRPLNGGIPGVVHVGIEAFKELGYSTSKTTYTILKGIYKYSYTYWLLDYRGNKSYVGACGFVSGLFPPKLKEYRNMRQLQKLHIWALYLFFTSIGLLTPVYLFNKIKLSIYKRIKR